MKTLIPPYKAYFNYPCTEYPDYISTSLFETADSNKVAALVRNRVMEWNTKQVVNRAGTHLHTADEEPRMHCPQIAFTPKFRLDLVLKDTHTRNASSIKSNYPSISEYLGITVLED
mmetsp:Transcript_23040/g.28283  ORF Transcript_23040/g.28283 Transcript_23040/m.28283 type:complete len:116 (+) Transcript_23040:108-455(+)